MSEQVMTGPPPPPVAPLPAWLREQILAPGEKVVWWQGPTEFRWQQWCKDHESHLMVGGFFNLVVLFLVGMAFILGGLAIGQVALIIGVVLGVALLFTALSLLTATDKHKRLVLTDRRLLIVVGRVKTEEFDLALLRQIIAALGSAIGTPTNDQPLDLSKLGQIQTASGAPSQHVTDLPSLLAMVKLAQQMEGVRQANGGVTSAGERPTG